MGAGIENKEEIIKVIGIGGCGINAINYMVKQGMRGVEFLAIDNDKLADYESIKALLGGANMVLIATGCRSGACISPVVAQIAQEMKILTMAVISKPLAPEADRMKYADEGFNRLSEHVDTWIVVPHAGFVENSGDEVNAQEACMADYHLMYEVVAGITEVITVDGMINIDAADVSLIMSKSGRCLMGKAAASGPGRARTAARCAIEKMGMTGAKSILLNITSNNSLRLKELAVVLECIKFTAPEATIIFGAGIDETMGEEMNVAVYATGFGVS